MTGRLKEESYGIYIYPDAHIYGVRKDGVTTDGNDVSERQAEFVVDEEHRVMILRSATGFRRALLTLPYAGMMALRDAMEKAMDDMWMNMTEEERDAARDASDRCPERKERVLPRPQVCESLVPRVRRNGQMVGQDAGAYEGVRRVLDRQGAEGEVPGRIQSGGREPQSAVAGL